jgi:hypothetical protein
MVDPPLAEPFTHSPGFGGLCAVIAAVLTLAGAAVALRQKALDDRRKGWWARFTWVVDQTPQLSTPLLFELLDQLVIGARSVHDEVLLAFAEEYSADAYEAVSAEEDVDVP